MEDKRVTRTRRRLKQTLIDLAGRKAFEQITVTEICREAHASRITFYAHYSDKYELADEIFRDMRASASRRFYRLQAENNPDRELIAGYCNLLDCILDVYFGQSPFFSHATPQDSPWLYYTLHHYITENVEDYAARHPPQPSPPYTLPQLTAFLCNGLWGFIEQGRADGQSLDQARREAKALLRALLESGALSR